MTSVLRIVVVVWLATTLVFIMLRLLPGDAVSADEGFVSAGQAEQRRQSLGLDEPLYIQYQTYITDILLGNWGNSWRSDEPVETMIMSRLGPTLALGFGAFAVALSFGLGLGITSTVAWQPIQAISNALITISQAVPMYVSALLLIYVFSLELKWLPASGSATPLHLILPCGVLGFHAASGIAAVLRSNLIEVYAMPHMLTARAKGLYPIDQLEHAIRLAILPTLSAIAIQAGFLLGGTVIIEVLFVRRGLGSLLFDAVLERDYPVVQALTVLSTLFYMLSISGSRLAQKLIDPRPTL